LNPQATPIGIAQIAFTLLFILGARLVFNGLSSKDGQETKSAAHSF
jgi:hypothetical protein